MISPKMRPRFEEVVATPAADILARIKERLTETDCPCTGAIAGKHVHLRVCKQRRKLWSPFLSVDVEPHPDGAQLRGHFGPHPDVWTFFMALYAVLGFSSVVAVIFAYSQWLLGNPPSALWVVPIAVVLAAIIYGLALTGQRVDGEEAEAA